MKRLINFCRPSEEEMRELINTRVQSLEEAERVLKWAEFRLRHPVLSFLILVVASKYR